MTNPTLRHSIALQCEECGEHGRSLDTRLCATCAPKVRAQRLGEAVLRLVPDAKLERLDFILRNGMAMERLEDCGKPWTIEQHPEPCGKSVIIDGDRRNAGYRHALDDAVFIALRNVNE